MSIPATSDPYAVLGVPKDATTAAIRSSYRKLVLKCHPDKIKDESERLQRQDEFQRVQEAYELLTDEAKRAKHDQKVQNAEARKAAASSYPSPPAEKGDSGSSPSSTGYFKTTSYEFRNGKLYEQKTFVRSQPPPPQPEPEDEFRFAEESRPSARKYGGYERRQSTKDPEEKRKKKSSRKSESSSSKAADQTPSSSSRSTKEKPRESVRSSRSDRAKNRDKERRREQSEKQSRATAYVVSEDEEPDPARSYPTPPRSSNPPRNATPERKSPPPRWDSPKYILFEDSACEYIQRSKATASPPTHDRRPSAPSTYHRQPSSPHVFYDIVEPGSGDTARRSSARRTHTMRDDPAYSSADRREPPIEVVDPPLRGRASSRRTAPAPAASSGAGGIRVATGSGTARGGPVRSSTFQAREGKEPPTLRRAETTPISRPTATASSTKPRDRYDSGYSSPGTPEMHGTSPPKSSKFTIVDENDDTGPPSSRSSGRGGSGAHRNYLVEPHRRHQSVSPSRRRVTPVTVRATSRPAQTRSRDIPPGPSRSEATTTRVIPPSRNSPPLRHASGREGLFAEVNSNGSDDYSQRFSAEQIRYSPKIGREDIRFGHVKPVRPSVMRKESYAY